MALGVAVLQLLGLSQAVYSNIVINVFLLTAVLGLIRLQKFSLAALGLKFLPDLFNRHLFLSLIILGLYLLFYVFVIRISSFNPLTPAVIWGLLTTIIAVLAEELYFRGVLYGFLERRFSARTALIFSSIVFGLFHAQQGVRGIVLRTFTGWLWGSLRYASGMIYLLIFPIHYAYNTIWLLFAGNWSDPPVWGIIALPAIEFILGLVVVIMTDRDRNPVSLP
jgi:membrane protease YdiL (CAAX protease family)